MSEAPEVQAGIQQGPPNYITLSNVIVGNDDTNVYVRCDTDAPCQLRYRMWREKNPAVVYTETETPAGNGKRYQTLARSNLGAPDFGGDVVFVEISVPVPPNPPSPIMRSYTGQVRLTGARSVAKGNAVNVRWNSFAWNRYTWAQYNPKNEAALVTP